MTGGLFTKTPARGPRPPGRARWTALAAAGALALACGLVCWRSVAAAATDHGEFQVIVNASNPIKAVERSFVTQAFLKKIRRWPSGEAIQPADLHPDSGVRRRFCESVLGRSVEAVRSYWQQMIFSGRDLPPPELGTEDAVVDYVIRKPGAIGYVSPNASLRGARPVAIE